MNRTTLNSIGIAATKDIPIQDIFNPAIDARQYGLGEDDMTKLRALHSFVEQYEREVPVSRDVAVNSAEAAAALMYQTLRSLDHEEMWALFLRNNNTVISREMISMGGLDATTMNKRKIARLATMLNANGVIIYHNHPSGNPLPTQSDIQNTEQARDVLKAFDIRLVDHIIITPEKYFSFADSKASRLSSMQ